MKKTYILTGILLCSAIILVGAQTGFAWTTYEEGCQTCHGTGFAGLTPPLHTIHAAQACTICHPGAAGAIPIPTSTCAGCHPAADPGVCPLINVPTHAPIRATCLACHTPLSGCQAPTTTTVAPTTTTVAILLQLPDNYHSCADYHHTCRHYYNNSTYNYNDNTWRHFCSHIK